METLIVKVGDWDVLCWRERGGPIAVRIATVEGDVETFQALTAGELHDLADAMDREAKAYEDRFVTAR